MGSRVFGEGYNVKGEGSNEPRPEHFKFNVDEKVSVPSSIGSDKMESGWRVAGYAEDGMVRVIKATKASGNLSVALLLERGQEMYKERKYSEKELAEWNQSMKVNFPENN